MLLHMVLPKTSPGLSEGNEFGACRFYTCTISCFQTLLCNKSFPHLRAVFEEYGKLSKKTMEEVIKSEFSGDIKDSLLTIGRYL